MPYVKAKFAEAQEQEFKDVYITDTLRLMNENVAEIAGGKVITERYYDRLHPPQTDTRTEAEVIEHIRDGLERLADGHI